MATGIDKAWTKLLSVLEASIQKPLTPKDALVVLDNAEEWIEATRDALKEDIERGE